MSPCCRQSRIGYSKRSPDGTIDQAKADLAGPLDEPGPTEDPYPKLQPVPGAALDSVQDILTEKGLPADGDVTFVQERTAFVGCGPTGSGRQQNRILDSKFRTPV